VWLVQTKFNISDQRVNEVSAERLLRGRKHFSQSVRPMVSVDISKLAETDLVFVQPDAKINSVYYCENVLEQGSLNQKTGARQSGSKSCGLFSVGSVAADYVLSQNFRHWSAAASSGRLIDTLNQAIDQLPKRLTMVVKAKGCHVELCLNLPKCPCFTVFQMKIEQNSHVIVKFNGILGVLTIYAN